MYHGKHYWEDEVPVEARTESAILTYYPKAAKLQVAVLYLDKETGEKKRGRTVTLDMEDFQLNPQVGELLKRVLEDWR